MKIAKLFFFMLAGIMFLASVSKAQTTTYTQTYADCTISYSLFGSGNVVIAPLGVSCGVDHEISVQVYLAPQGGPSVFSSNSGDGTNVSTTADGPGSPSCDPSHTPACTINATAIYYVTIDGYDLSYSLSNP
jgi:hypothetical protein